jgi:hypothetical protein
LEWSDAAMQNDSPHRPDGLPDDEREQDASPTPTRATTDLSKAEEAERRIDSDVGLSPAAEQGASAAANLGRRKGSELFRE